MKIRVGQTVADAVLKGSSNMSPRRNIAIGILCLLIGAAMATAVSAGAVSTSASNGGKQCASAEGCTSNNASVSDCGMAAPAQATADCGACGGCDVAQ